MSLDTAPFNWTDLSANSTASLANVCALLSIPISRPIIKRSLVAKLRDHLDGHSVGLVKPPRVFDPRIPSHVSSLRPLPEIQVGSALARRANALPSFFSPARGSAFESTIPSILRVQPQTVAAVAPQPPEVQEIAPRRASQQRPPSPRKEEPELSVPEPVEEVVNVPEPVREVQIPDTSEQVEIEDAQEEIQVQTEVIHDETPKPPVELEEKLIEETEPPPKQEIEETEPEIIVPAAEEDENELIEEVINDELPTFEAEEEKEEEEKEKGPGFGERLIEQTKAWARNTIESAKNFTFCEPVKTFWKTSSWTTKRKKQKLIYRVTFAVMHVLLLIFIALKSGLTTQQLEGFGDMD